MKDFDLLTLRLFVAVCDTGSVQNVGEREHIDPSAITKRFSKLEKELGVKLLNRSIKGMTPTPEGKEFLYGARHLLGNANQLAEHVKNFPIKFDDTVKIIGATTIWSGFLPYDLGTFLNKLEHKNIHIEMDIGDRIAVVEAVKEGRVSMGVSWDRKSFKGLQDIAYRPQKLAVFVHKEHPLSHEKKLTYAAIAKWDRVGIESNRAIEIELSSKKLIPSLEQRFRAIAPNFEIALRLAEMQVGILIAPLEMKLFVHSKSLVAIPMEEEFSRRDYYICFQDENTLSSSAKLLLKHLSSAANE